MGKTVGQNHSSHILKIKLLIQNFDHEIKFMWTRAHVGTIGNETADAYAKMSTNKENIDCRLALDRKFLNQLLLKDILLKWQANWTSSIKGREVFELCPVVHLKGLHGNFFINQLITGHGALAKHQNRFFHKSDVCACGKAVEDRSHVILHCERWQDIRKTHFSQCSLLQLFCTKRVRIGLEAIMRKKLEDVLQDLPQ
ncbi:hypothetical protein CEXT_736931 [Caerostris extrusa]|uniref:RNase H type-1 domain-containing protein n=1 Tax=Caerostris extrusa TaxID=172846 RepID=A0AAV4MMH0_CAEEX|nr:hypothetical protein CEXT_736931 [Caerostris extrusa]